MNINKNSILGFLLFFVLPAQGLMAQDLSAHISLEPKGSALTGCSKTMSNCLITVGPDTGCYLPPGSIKVTNNSNITAKNIVAFSSDLNFTNYITQINGCSPVLDPGLSCVITFYVDVNAIVGFTLSDVKVQGSNTNATYFDIKTVIC